MDTNKFNIIPDEIENKLNKNKRVNSINYKSQVKEDINIDNKFLMTAEDILNSFKLKTIDELYNFVDNIIKNNNISWFNPVDNRFYELNINLKTHDSDKVDFNTINRVIQAWVIYNFKILKTHNKSLLEVMVSLCPFDEDMIDMDKLYKEGKDYLEYWFNKHDKDEFDLDLLNSFYIYIYKKIKN
jgi:hypothetical protein